MSEIYKLFLELWSVERTTSKYATWRFLPRIFVIIVLYMIMDKVLISLTHLPTYSYYSPVLYWEFLLKIFYSKYGLVFIPMMLLVIFFRKHLNVQWKELEYGNAVRVFVALTALGLTWNYASYDYNLYFNQGHYTDRVLLIGFMCLMVYRPVFVLPFLTLVLTVIWQFEFISSYSIAAPSVPLRLLILFASFLIVHVLIKKFNVRDFIFLSCCLLASHYWVSGTGKLNWAWMSSDQILFLLPTTYANGWWSILNPEDISDIVNALMPFNGVLRVFTLIIEIGSICILWHRRVAIFILLGFVMFHLGIFIVSGIFFWLWIVVDATLLGILYFQHDLFDLRFYNKPEVIVSMILIVGAPVWCHPTKLAWHDVPATYTYKLQGVTNRGSIHVLPPDFFAPYDYDFSLGRLSYLSKAPLLPITWGSTTDAELSNQLTQLNHVEEFFDFEQKMGGIRYDSLKSMGFESFVKQYVGNWNKNLSKQSIGSSIQAPRQIWTFPENSLAEPLDKVRVLQVTTFFHNGDYHELRTELLKEMKIPAFR